MKTVISASRRTDIPAFYLAQFMEMIRNGRAEVINPFYRHKSKTVFLDPNSVEWIVFWSRDYQKFLKHHTFFSDYRLFFHFTVLTHNSLFEKVNPDSGSVVKQMESLANTFGADHIIWRYDPVITWEENSIHYTNFSPDHFKFLCQQFSEIGIHTCYFSFATLYKKFVSRMKNRYPGLDLTNDIPFQTRILTEMQSIAGHFQINLYSCCNDYWIGNDIGRASCISGSLLNSLSQNRSVSVAKYPGRPDCGCTRSVDIGNYLTQPCYFGCLYCYANPVI